MKDTHDSWIKSGDNMDAHGWKTIIPWMIDESHEFNHEKG